MLGAHKDEFEDMLSILDLKFDIMGLTETKLIKGQTPTFKTSIDGYNDYHTPTESKKGGTVLFIDKNIDSKPRKDLEKKLYLSKKLESSFAEILIKGKTNVIVGCIYKHPSMDIDEFNALFEQTMDKISSENKDIYLLGDFNINLLKIDEDNKIDEFYNVICSNFLVPHIIHPTRITSDSATLIDNIFSNNLNFSQALSGNLTVSISDHLPHTYCT